jgi:hypothetical protein
MEEKKMLTTEVGCSLNEIQVTLVKRSGAVLMLERVNPA